MLIGTNTDMYYQEAKYGLGNVSVGEYQPIYDSEPVCKYVTKHMKMLIITLYLKAKTSQASLSQRQGEF